MKHVRSRAPDPPDASAEPDIDVLAARLSAAELNEFAAALPDDSLAHLMLAGVRQLRRRLARAAGRGSRSSRKGTSVLERAARQLAAELGGFGGGDA
ncbi:MAG TPA: hypothetical protein VJ779_18580 [Acetobacteraceae bacterium]|nr:hypothetical protein [Acetobacteraceae bacterium]